MAPHYPLHDGETGAVPREFGFPVQALEHFEQLAVVRHVEADAVVLHVEDGLLALHVPLTRTTG